MEITGEYLIQAPRNQVWDALNDPDVLRATIPGCETLEQAENDQYTAKIKSKIGPVSATFNCKIELTNLNPPVSYTLSGEGQGGVAGFANGSANVNLDEDGPGTLLRYSAEFKIGGKLAQIGSRMVAGVTRKTADQFFANFAELVNAMSAVENAENSAVESEALPAAASATTEATEPTVSAAPPATPSADADTTTAAATAKPTANTATLAAEKSGSSLWAGLGAVVVVLILLWFLLR